MAVHPFLNTPGSLLYWLRNECKAEDRWNSAFAMLRSFIAFAEDEEPDNFIAYTTFVERFPRWRGGGVWEYPEWVKTLMQRLNIQASFFDPYNPVSKHTSLTRDVVLDTLLDIAYPTEVRRSHAEAVHAGL